MSLVNVHKSSLKNSHLVVLAAVLMILAPVGNFLFSAYSIGILKGDSSVWLYAIRSISNKDIFVSVLLLSSGLLLLRRHRYSWILAVIILLGIALLNLANYFQWLSVYNSEAQETQLWVSLLTTTAALVIMSYLAYPFIDRRHGLIDNDQRYDVNMLGVIQLLGETVSVRMISLSKSGARLEITDHSDVSKTRNAVEGLLVIEGLPEKYFDLIHQEKNILRIKWHKRIWKLKSWLR